MNICVYVRITSAPYYVYTMYNVSRAAFDKISGDLSQKIDNLTSELKIVSESVTNAHKSQSRVSYISSLHFNFVQLSHSSPPIRNAYPRRASSTVVSHICQ